MGPIHTKTFLCSVCNQTKLVNPPPSCTTGYGTRRDSDTKVCFACCAEETRAEMKQGIPQVLYLTQDKYGTYWVSNWPGSLKLLAGEVRKSFFNGFGNWAIPRLDTWFHFEGKHWWGVNKGGNEILRCRVIKG